MKSWIIINIYFMMSQRMIWAYQGCPVPGCHKLFMYKFRAHTITKQPLYIWSSDWMILEHEYKTYIQTLYNCKARSYHLTSQLHTCQHFLNWIPEKILRSPGGQSPLLKMILRFLSWFLGVLPRCKKSELFLQRNLQQHDLRSFYKRK